MVAPFTETAVLPLRDICPHRVRIEDRLLFAPAHSALQKHLNLIAKIMAKKPKKTETDKGIVYENVNPNAAGIDISNTEMQVSVPKDRSENSNRKFGVYTRDLREICEWLVKCRIDTVAMESTGVYWVGLYKMLQSYGIDVLLTDAASIKSYRVHKTDANDAERLRSLHTLGLLRPCHQVENQIRTMRNIYRERKSLVEDSTTSVNRIHKALTQMNIKLSVAISNLTGKTGRAIIEAIIAGERDPHKLAALASSRCKKSKEEIAKSLEGDWDRGLLLIVKTEYNRYLMAKSDIADLDSELEAMLQEMVLKLEKTDDTKLQRANKKQNDSTAKVYMDIERFCYLLWDVNLMKIPGFSSGTLLALMSELGPDFISKFETSDQFCSWCDLAPDTKISGGKVLSSRLPKRHSQVGQIFRVAAGTLHGSKEQLGNFYRRIKSRGGPTKAHVATAHKLAKIFYKMVKDKVEYDPNKVGPSELELLKRKHNRCQKEADKLQRKICELEAS